MDLRIIALLVNNDPTRLTSQIGFKKLSERTPDHYIAIKIQYFFGIGKYLR